MGFSEKFLKYFNSLKHAGLCDMYDTHVVSARVGEAVNQDVLQFNFAIKNAKIIQARFKATGIPATYAAAEFVCCWMEGKNIMDIKQGLNAGFILENLGLNKHYIHIAHLVCDGVLQCLQKT